MGTNFTGNITQFFANGGWIPSNIDLSFNTFSGDISTLTMGKSGAVRTFRLEGNHELTGDVSEWDVSNWMYLDDVALPEQITGQEVFAAQALNIEAIEAARVQVQTDRAVAYSASRMRSLHIILGIVSFHLFLVFRSLSPAVTGNANRVYLCGSATFAILIPLFILWARSIDGPAGIVGLILLQPLVIVYFLFLVCYGVFHLFHRRGTSVK